MLQPHTGGYMVRGYSWSPGGAFPVWLCGPGNPTALAQEDNRSLEP
ncbi:MAG: hypothetical protein ACKO3C_01915 [Betaproteobacteria bacterium]